jgi:predicted lipase
MFPDNLLPDPSPCIFLTQDKTLPNSNRNTTVGTIQDELMLEVVVHASVTIHTQEEAMIVVRNTFQLKFGKAKDAKALIKENEELMKKYGHTTPKFMTDLTGEFYTLVMETSYDTLSSFEKSSTEAMGEKEFSQWYGKFIPLVESGRREIYTLLN